MAGEHTLRWLASAWKEEVGAQGVAACQAELPEELFYLRIYYFGRNFGAISGQVQRYLDHLTEKFRQAFQTGFLQCLHQLLRLAELLH